MSHFFKPYEGKSPYVFVSYAHRQSDAVVDTIRILHDKGWRVWYDEGIPAGSDWPANIAQHMQECERVLFFLSGRAMESPNCYSEMRTAARLGKPILVVRLEDTPVRENWKDILEGSREIPLLDTASSRAGAILESGFFLRRFRRSLREAVPWRALGLAASLVLFLLSAGILAALAAGFFATEERERPAVDDQEPEHEPEPEPVQARVVELGEAERYFAVNFPDRQQERAIRRVLDIPEEEIYRWQIAEIRELYFCGNMTTDGLESVAFDKDGTCRVNGAPVVTGQVSDLSLLKNAVKLEKLALICQPLEDLTSLGGHLLLEELSLAGSSVSDISDLKDLPGLKTLRLEYTEVKDLTPLEEIPSLRNVTVSRQMLPLQWSDDAAYSVLLIQEP